MGMKLGQTAVKALAAAGTAEVVATAGTHVKSAILQADPANTGNIYIGDLNVDDTNGLVLDAGQSVSLVASDGQFINLGAIFFDGGTTGDKLRVIYEVVQNA